MIRLNLCALMIIHDLRPESLGDVDVLANRFSSNRILYIPNRMVTHKSYPLEGSGSNGKLCFILIGIFEDFLPIHAKIIL